MVYRSKFKKDRKTDCETLLKIFHNGSWMERYPEFNTTIKFFKHDNTYRLSVYDHSISHDMFKMLVKEKFKLIHIYFSRKNVSYQDEIDGEYDEKTESYPKIKHWNHQDVVMLSIQIQREDEYNFRLY